MQLLWGCRRLCDHAESSFRVSRQVVDVPVVQVVVASRATDNGGNHGSDSAVEQIVASRATDHEGRRARYLQRHVPVVVQTFQFSDKDADVPVLCTTGAYGGPDRAVRDKC